MNSIIVYINIISPAEEYNIQYCKYVKNIKRNGFYSCQACALKKRTEMMINNNLSLNPDSQKKKKETFIKNYGVDNPSKAEKIKIKKKILVQNRISPI